MKKVLFIVICSIILIGLSSCRSTSKPCGLAENSSIQTQQLQQSDFSKFL